LAVCATRLARLYRRDPAEVFALAVLNPVTLLLLVGSAHNDAFMLALLASGLLLAKRGRPALGILLCSLAAAVKFPAGLGVLYIAWGWLGPRAGWRDRLRPLLTALLICFCVMEVLARATGLGWGWLGALGTPGTVRTWLDPSTAIGLMGSAVSRFLGIGPSEALILSVTRGAGDVLAVAVCVALLWHSPRLGRAKTLGLGLLTVVALGPIIQPWYFSWGIVVLAPVAAGRLRAAVIGLSVFAVLLPLQDGGAVLGPLGVAAAVVALVGVVLVVSRPGPFVVPTRRALARLGVPRGASDP
ncbi:MAG: polyprenol phosphomannose-dependent alpha 1,6 mannosyltransferase MptB, partial [Acidimicrobiales bacterium]